MARRPSIRLTAWRPLVTRTRGSTTEAVYGLILALSVIAVSWEVGPADAGRTAVDVLVTAIVFWLAHVYSQLLGDDVAEERRPERSDVTQALRFYLSLVEVVIPIVLVLLLGAVGAVSDYTALLAATVISLAELAAAGGYAASRRGARVPEVVASALFALALGTVVVLLKVLVH
jgi:heme O synthase-like polyprenyltransferase